MKLSGCSRNSCTVINVLKCFQDTSAFPSVSSLDTVLGLSINVHVVHSPSCPYRRLFGCHWGREQALGRAWGECTCTRAGDETRGGVSLTPRLFWGLMPAVLLRASWRPARMFFLVPRPKTKLNILKHHRLRSCHGIWGKVGVFNRWFHHHSSWTKNQARMLRRTRKVAEQNTGYISQGSDHFPGQSQSVHPFFPTILGSVSGNFKSTTGRMNKYLVTSLIMWIATELLCKKTKTLCRYFSYKLM